MKLDEVSYSGEGVLVESTSSGRPSIKWWDWVVILQSKALTHNCSCLKKVQGQKWRRT